MSTTNRTNNAWKAAFFVTVFFLLVIIMIAIIDYNSYHQTVYRISRAVENENQCQGYNSGICELIVDFNQAIPSSPVFDAYSKDMATFAANLVASVEYGFLQDSNNATPTILVPFSVSLVSTLSYNGTTFGIICVGGGIIWIAFRGTRTSAEWEKDLLFQQVSYPHSALFPTTQKYFSLRSTNAPNRPPTQAQVSSPYFTGLVHEGFLDVYDCLRTQIQSTLENLSETKIVVCGHSLGGAVSMVLCADTFVNKQTCCYVFGCPRVGNQTFADFIDERSLGIFRLTNDSDIICQLPTSVAPNLHGGDPNHVYLYTHAGTSTNFEDNRGALLFNHAMQCYLNFLRSS